MTRGKRALEALDDDIRGDFDISQDGSQVVLERVQERSDVVLWILYHNLASTQPSDRRARSIRESLQPGG